jgi:hypothetical protein
LGLCHFFFGKRVLVLDKCYALYYIKGESIIFAIRKGVESSCRRLFADQACPIRLLAVRGGGSGRKGLKAAPFLAWGSIAPCGRFRPLRGLVSAPAAATSFRTRMGAREETLNLKDTLICIDCEEVFIPQGSRCNPRCPACASSVCIPLSSWIGTEQSLDNGKGDAHMAAQDEAPAIRRRMEIVHSTPIAA